jgi:hypothetical protein
MAYIGEDFDPTTVPPSERGDFEPIPAGWYSARCTAAEVKDTKAGSGNYLNIRWDIVGPSHVGRVIWQMITLRNANPTAETIGRQQLAALCAATGIARLSDSDQLVGVTCDIKVAVDSAKDGYEAKNVVKACRAGGGAGAAPSAGAGAPPWSKPAPAAPAPAQANSGSTPPWLRK